MKLTVFERDASISFRAQGYRLRLSDLGLEAIEYALGPERWQEFWDHCGKTGGAGFAALDAVRDAMRNSSDPDVH